MQMHEGNEMGRRVSVRQGHHPSSSAHR